MDENKIKINPGLRSLAKLALNYFCGKFEQGVHVQKCVFLTQAEDIYKLITDYSKKVSDFHIINENLVVMEYTKSNDFMVVNNNTNVTIATFCMSYARIKLWKLMPRLEGHVLYHDTDSVMYTYLLHEVQPEIGTFLGQLIDELTCQNVGCEGCQEGHWIVEFVSCRAKNYGYHLNMGEVMCKVRGFSLNYRASKTLNLHSMRDA